MILNFFYQILIFFQYHPWIHPWSWFFFSNLVFFILILIWFFFFSILLLILGCPFIFWELIRGKYRVTCQVSWPELTQVKQNFLFYKEIKMALLKKIYSQRVLTWFWLLLSWVDQITGQTVFLIVSHQVSSPKISFETWSVLSSESQNHRLTHRFN